MINSSTAKGSRLALVAVATAVALLASACGSSTEAGGDGYPKRDVQIIVPYPAGSGIDTTTRAIVDIINDGDDFGKRLQVVNREGGAGTVGTTTVLNAKPDGYTIGVVPDGPLTLVPQTQKVSYDPKKMTVIEELIAGPIMFVVPNDSPIADVAGMLKAAERNPSGVTIGEGPLNYRIPVDMLEEESGVKFKRVKFDGDQATTTALLGNNLDIGVMQLASALPQLTSGKLRALALTAAEPNALAPDIPTFASAGFDLVWEAYNDVIAPAGLDDGVQKKLAAVFNAAVKSEEFAAAAKKLGLTPSGVGPEKAAQRLKDKTISAADVLGIGK